MQTRIIAVIVVAIILIGGGAFVLHSKNSNNAPTNQAASTPTATASPQANSAEKTIADLFSMGGNKKCTFSTTSSSGAKTDGIFYVSGTNVRGELKMNSTNGKTQTTNILRLGDENYIWGDALPSGIKMKLSASDFANNSQVQQSLSTNTKTNFNCSDSSVDSSMFIVPTNVRFMDVGSMMSPSSVPHTSPGGAMIQSQCAACNALSGDQKTQCLSIYHCQ